jgi:hypothetical protein
MLPTSSRWLKKAGKSDRRLVAQTMHGLDTSAAQHPKVGGPHSRKRRPFLLARGRQRSAAAQGDAPYGGAETLSIFQISPPKVTT